MGPVELGLALGRLEEGQRSIAAKLDAHTLQDGESFKALSDKIDRFDVSGAVRKIAWRWAAGISGGVLVLAQIAEALGLIP